MKKARNFVVGFILIISLLLTSILQIPGFILRIFSKDLSQKYMAFWIKILSKYILIICNVKLEITGLENVPKNQPLTFVANHQSLFDIPIIIATLPQTPFFVAKRELAKVPIFKAWLNSVSVLIDRNNKESALKAIKESCALLQKGKSILIFPEGTRSKGITLLGRFKTGGLNQLIETKKNIIPLTVVGSAELLEKNKGLTAGKVKVIIDKPIEIENTSQETKQTIIKKIEKTMRQNLTEFNAEN